MKKQPLILAYLIEWLIFSSLALFFVVCFSLIFTRKPSFEVKLGDLLVAVGFGFTMASYNAVMKYKKNKKNQQQSTT